LEQRSTGKNARRLALKYESIYRLPTFFKKDRQPHLFGCWLVIDRLGDCPDFRVNENGIVPFTANNAGRPSHAATTSTNSGET
jgi:hypothetical protein